LELGGLVMPTQFMTPEDAETFFAFVPWIKNMRSLKIRMPLLKAGKGTAYMQNFWRHVARMTELRELWLADGLGTWHQPPGRPGRHIPDRYPTEPEFRRLSTLFAAKCPELVYLRIMDRAWTITRPDAQNGAPTLGQLTPSQVESDLPWAFDFSKPKVI
jgi:hypothetical protein